MRKKIYIAGPMTGYPEYNFPAFNAAAARLRADGWEVVNPVEIVNACGGPAWYEGDGLVERAVRDFERSICRYADAIYLLRGWERSRGARAELYNFLEAHLNLDDTVDAQAILEGSEADA